MGDLWITLRICSFNSDNDSEAENNVDENLIEDVDLDCDISVEELRSAISSQNNNKSTGEDNVIAEIFKSGNDSFSSFLLKLYNKLFNSSQYPDSWANGIITPVYKKGDVNDAKNYRGITLINILAKTHSQILLNRLSNGKKSISNSITRNLDSRKAHLSQIVFYIALTY